MMTSFVSKIRCSESSTTSISNIISMEIICTNVNHTRICLVNIISKYIYILIGHNKGRCLLCCDILSSVSFQYSCSVTKSIFRWIVAQCL